MAIKKIVVPADKIQVGHVVDNRNATNPIEVLRVNAWSDHGKVKYQIELGRNGEVDFEVELNKENSLTYTVVDNSPE